MPKPTKDTTAVLAPPPDAFEAIDQASEEAGGAWKPPAGYEGSIGSTMFDMPSSKDGTVTVLMPKDNIDTLPGQALVRVKSLADGRTYLGAVVEGPFAEPDGLRADATPMVVTTVQGGLLMPQVSRPGADRDHWRASRYRDDRPPSPEAEAEQPRFRPSTPKRQPKCWVSAATCKSASPTASMTLLCEFRAIARASFLRHIGILGTTGGGKSTTVSGLVAKAQQVRHFGRHHRHRR